MVECECSYCDKVFERRPSNLNDEENYCSKDCWRDDTRIEVECAYCGRGEKIPQSKFDKKDKHFCDLECKSSHDSNIVGKEHPLYDRVEVHCAWCGDSKEVKKGRVDRRDNFFCNQNNCYAKWRSENIYGENHHQYKNGSNNLKYGPGWEKKRKERLKIDEYSCLRCGKTNDENKNITGQSLSVHHIKPFREFDSENGYPNKMDNLASLCNKCHREIENFSEKKQRDILMGDDN